LIVRGLRPSGNKSANQNSNAEREDNQEGGKYFAAANPAEDFLELNPHPVLLRGLEWRVRRSRGGGAQPIQYRPAAGMPVLAPSNASITLKQTRKIEAGFGEFLADTGAGRLRDGA
jgi:hypothetical protein